MPTTSAPPRSAAPPRRCALLDPASQPHAAPPPRTNRHLYDRGEPARPDALRGKGRAVSGRSTPPRARAIRASRRCRSALAGSWSVVEIVRADGFVATDIRPLVRLNVSIVVEENGRRETGSLRHRRALSVRSICSNPRSWNRAIDEALAQALVNLDAVDAPAGEMHRAARPRLARRAAPRSGRPRARRRFQPQGHQRLFGPHRPARRRARRDRGRRRRDGQPGRRRRRGSLSHRRRRHADAARPC